MNKELLREIGLTNAEINVYNSLLSSGSTSVGRIVEETGMYRKNIYDALTKLIDKGLVTYVIENKLKVFQVKDPDNLSRFLEEQKTKISEVQQRLKDEIVLLRRQFHSLAPEIESQVYRGVEGIKTILRDCLNYKEVLFIGGTGEVENRMPFFWPQYNKQRQKKKIIWKVLFIYEARKKEMVKSKYFQYRLLPKILSGLNVIYIYGDNVANVIWLQKPLAFAFCGDPWGRAGHEINSMLGLPSRRY